MAVAWRGLLNLSTAGLNSLEEVSMGFKELLFVDTELQVHVSV
jgi:hypothetical protein